LPLVSACAAPQIAGSSQSYFGELDTHRDTERNTAIATRRQWFGKNQSGCIINYRRSI
jgi:hypothetical protein